MLGPKIESINPAEMLNTFCLLEIKLSKKYTYLALIRQLIDSLFL